MTDIVERLRQAPLRIPIELEAADEIERLRALLNETRQQWREQLAQKDAEIERLQVYEKYKINFESVARDNERMEAEIEKLREAMRVVLGNNTEAQNEIERLQRVLVTIKTGTVSGHVDYQPVREYIAIALREAKCREKT